MAKIALCIIATNNYCDFVTPLIESAEKYFLQGHEIHYHIFSNNMAMWPINLGINPIRLYMHPVFHEPWPAMTLKRYEFYSSVDLSGYDYVYHIDADMLFVDHVGEEIFGELVAVHHPGFYRGGGSWETREESWAYVKPEKRLKYLAGGVQGGWIYWNYCKGLSKRIELDLSNDITAVWNDESYWNELYSSIPNKFTILDPSYCMVEEPEKRKAWGIDHFKPRILALRKDHSKYQK